MERRAAVPARPCQRLRDIGHRGVADRDQNSAGAFGKPAQGNGGDADEFGRARGVSGVPASHGYNRLAAHAKEPAQGLRNPAGSGDADRFLKTLVHVRNSTDSFEKTRTAAKKARPA